MTTTNLIARFETADTGRRIQLAADAVVASYIHAISPRHQPAPAAAAPVPVADRES